MRNFYLKSSNPKASRVRTHRCFKLIRITEVVVCIPTTAHMLYMGNVAAV
jgi:hypothetical protein